MLTPQDIQAQEFAKAVFGGYDMAAVDDFLEQVTEDYTALYKENAVLKGKLKVLVEKVEEYRSTEDAMRMALLTAQKMSDEMMEETKKKCDEMLAAAARDSDESRAKAAEDISHEDMKLEAAKVKTAAFVSASRQIIDQYLAFLGRLEGVTEDFGGVAEPEPPAPEHEPVTSPEPEPVRTAEPAPASVPAPEADPEPEVTEEPTRSLDDMVASIMDEFTAPAETEPPAGPYDPDAGTRRIDTEAIRRMYAGEGETKRLDWDEEDELTTPRPKFNFSDLKFGSNYSDKEEK